MRSRRIGLLVAGLTVLGATRAAATDDLAAPSVCSPPCPDGQTCVDSRCAIGGPRPTAPPPPAAAAPVPTPPPAPGSTTTTPPRQKRRLLALPYLGVHSYQNWEMSLFGPGFRVGALIGGRLTDEISVNAELTFNAANVDPVLGPIQESMVGFALSPLWQLPTGPVEIVFGPKAGMFFTERQTGTTSEGNSRGWVLGVNAGLFKPVSAATSFGVLLAYELSRATRVCGRQGATETCYPGSGEGLVRLLGVTAAVLF